MRQPFVLLACAAALALPAAAPAQPARKPAPAATLAPPGPPGPPGLIVAISVDQFSADLFARYRRYFIGGLARLQQGVVFPSGYQAHAATETCPGHSTLLTGMRPARTGIIANMWYDPAIARADKRIYCAEDERDPASSSRNPVVSAGQLRVPTLGERMKAAWPVSRNVAVSAKDRAVMMMGGHAIDAAYWWQGSAFTSLAGRPLSPAAQAQNAATAAQIETGAPELAVPAWCAAADAPVPVGGLAMGTGRFPLEPGRPDAFRVSPRIDGATGDLAARLVDEMKLGQGAAPDILSVSFSATDYIGHAFGSGGAEMCIQLAELDRTIGRLLAVLDARKLDYAVVLTADHGGSDTPERLGRQAYPAAMRADKALTPAALGKTIGERTGIVPVTGPLLYGDGPFGDYYVSRNLTAGQRAQVVAVLVSLLKSHPEVAAVFTAQQIAEAPMPTGSPQDWTLLDRARASYDKERSGDVVLLLGRGVVPIPDPAPGYTATHGSVWDYDRRVPMLFWRPGLSGFEQPNPVETVDIAPTLAALIGLPVPAGTFDGRCLDLDGGAADTCQPGQ
ncbi:MAG: alkaline phosphatase family protein [Novosphingobium sp.]|jgi:predicted AlkP superfamily pyrophosphatase or phosphodiesterase|nr:alkaline phosphatase family protein [Novosphingobium sp.]